MAKLKTFEQFVTEMDRAEEIEKDIVDQGTPEENDENDADRVQSPEQQANEAADVTGTEADELKGKTKDVSGKIEFDDKAVDTDVQDLGDKVEAEIKDIPTDDKIGKEVNEEETAEEVEEEMEEAKKTVSEILKSCCEMMKTEAKVWEEDEYDEHTIETYMSENAALLGGLVASTLREMKEEYALEAYEAACNSMKESFCKKIDETKDVSSAASSAANQD